MKKLFLPFILFCALFSQAQTVPINTFVNKPITDPEVNSYGRGAHYWNGTAWDNSQAPQIPPGTGTTGAKTFYWRYEWADMESDSGVYTFTKASLGSNFWKSIQWHLEYCANYGMLYGFGGIMTAYDGPHGNYYDGAWSQYPEYVHNAMQAEPVPDWKYTATENWIPNWNSDFYLARFRAVNDTLLKYIKAWTYTPTSGPWAGKLVKGGDLVDFIDMRGYGNFGEWHTYPWTDATPVGARATDSTFKKVIDINTEIFGDYPLHIPVGAFDDNPWAQGTAFTTWYALTRQTRHGLIGWRRDNIGDVGLDMFLIGNTFTGPGGWKADTAILARWKYAMITGEPLNGSGTCCPYYHDIRREIGIYHYAGFGNGNYGNNSAQTWDTIRTVFKLTGYRYNINGGQMSSYLVSNQAFNVSVKWRNVGAAPMYQKRWKVKYQLKTASDSVVATYVSSFNPYLYLPDTKDSTVFDVFNAGAIPPGSNYKLTVIIQDTTNLSLNIPLAVNVPTRNADGSYTLRTGIDVYASPLPVFWSNVYLQTLATYNKITWNAACSPFTARFAVQRSTDAIAFTDIASVSPTFNCNTASYQYIDNIQSSVPLFYRLKGIDIDSSFNYSVILKANPNLNSQVTLQPNPTTGSLIVGINNNLFGQGVVQVYNGVGQLVKAQNFVKRSVWQNVFMDLSSLANGTYSVNVRVLSTLVSVKTIVKN